MKNNRIMKPNELQVPLIRSQNSSQFAQSPMNSPRKKKSSFITQRNRAQQTVIQCHNELNQCIDMMDKKIQKIIQNHDAQFLIAYRSHVKRVRQQMQELRSKSQTNNNSSSNQIQRIQTLEKELIIFRQESLKLFDKLTQKQKTIDLLNSRVQQLQTQNIFNKKTMTDLLKKNKYLEGNLSRIQSNNIQQTQKKSLSHLDVNSIGKNYKNIGNIGKKIGTHDFSFYQNKETQFASRPFTSAIQSKRNSFYLKNMTQGNTQVVKNEDEFVKYFKLVQVQLVKQKLLDVKKIMQILTQTRSKMPKQQKQLSEARQTRGASSYLPQKYATFYLRKGESFQSQNIQKVKSISRNQAQKTEMQNLFSNCVDSIKKQIIRRKDPKNLNMTNFFKQNSSMSLVQFKKIDFFRLMELIISNQDVIKGIHQKLFVHK